MGKANLVPQEIYEKRLVLWSKRNGRIEAVALLPEAIYQAHSYVWYKKVLVFIPGAKLKALVSCFLFYPLKPIFVLLFIIYFYFKLYVRL